MELAGRSSKKKAYVPGVSRSLKQSEELVYDPKAYLLFHTFETTYPCLSFEPLPDALGEDRRSFPMTTWLVTGTQADRAKENELLVMRLSNMHANKKTLEAKEKEQNGGEEEEAESSSDEESSDDEEEEEGTNCPVAKSARMHAAIIPHFGGINRIKSQTLGPSKVCAVWNDQQKVQLWNLGPAIAAVDAVEMGAPTRSHKMDKAKALKESLLFSYEGHSAEGFALAWSPLQTGTLASGDVHRKIFLWHMTEGGQWLIDQRPLTDHQGSVEDLAWSPTEESLLMSCSTDRTIRLWDVRVAQNKACVCTVRDAHEADVNVLALNQFEPLVLSGGDDAVLRVWSMKTIQYNQPVAQFRHHKKPITSVEWSPHDGTVFMASGDDDQTTIWDLALEENELTGDGEAGMEEHEMEQDGGQKPTGSADAHRQLPPQLLFIHMGQKEVKEVHWHKQCPGLAFTTALDGFHVFKTINS